MDNANSTSNFINLVERGCLKGIKELLEKEENRKCMLLAGETGSTALLKASGMNQLQVVRFLLDNGAQVNRQFPGQFPDPLYEAASKGNSSVCKELLRRGAKINPNLVSYFAATNGHYSTVQCLLRENQ